MSQEEDRRSGDWIQTYTGRKFWPLDPRTEEICIEDIAHALSNQCRFTGHTLFHYSVAQHSLLVCKLCPIEHALFGLLHDAAEAYLCDIADPLKRQQEFAGYRDAERRLISVINRHFWLPQQMPDIVRISDMRALATEFRDVMSPGQPRRLLPDPDTEKIEPLLPSDAEAAFLKTYESLVRLGLRSR